MTRDKAFFASDCGAFLALSIGAGMRADVARAEFIDLATSTWDAIADIEASVAKKAAEDATALKASAISEINKGGF